MKKLTLTIFALALIYHGVIAQDGPNVWGRITQKEVDMTTYDKDPEAEAVILSDIGESFFIRSMEGGFNIQFTRTKRMKILDNSGLDFAEISIPYYHDGHGKTEMVKSIEAISYNVENGKLIKKELDESSVYQEVINEKWNVKKFAIPDVKAGTIFEYKYVLETPFHFNLPDWYFQDKVPTVYSSYTVKMIPFYNYVYIVQGINRFDHHSSKASTGIPRHFGGVEFQEMISSFVLEDVPAFKDESYMTSVEDYIIKMDFQLAEFINLSGAKTSVMSDWSELNKALLKHENFGKYVKRSQKIASQALENNIDLVGLEPREKAEMIVNYVKSAFTWDGYNGKYASKSPKALYKEKTGSAADINLFLMSMLESAGIDVKPVIISTRKHGKIRENYPFSHYFNYVILMVNIDDHAFLTDGTEKNIAFNRIPTRCINDKGLVVSTEDITWISLLQSNVKSYVYRNIEVVVDPEGQKASAKLMTNASEYDSYTFKQKYDNDSSKLCKHLMQSGFNTIRALETKNYEDASKPYVLSCEGTIKLEMIDDKVLISPFIGFPLKENKLTQKSRSYPVDFTYANAAAFYSRVIIPSDYTVVDFPEKVAMSNTLADISLDYSMIDNVITVEGKYAFKKSVYGPGEYARIKYYLDNIVDKFNSQIVIAKSTNF